MLQAREESAEREGRDFASMVALSVVNKAVSPNRPTATTEKSSPSNRSIWPKVKRAGPAIGSRPIMLSPKPSASATKALMRSGRRAR